MTNAEDSPQARNMTLGDLDGVVKLHRECFPGLISIFTALNDDILKCYYAEVIEEPESCATVLEEPNSGDIVGLAIGTMKPGFQRRFMRRHFFRFSWSIFRAFFVNPVVRKAVWERLKHIKRLLVGKGDIELADLGVSAPEGAEALFMLVGVSARWRGEGNAERLVEYFVARMCEKGVTRIRGSVPPNNLASLILYKCLGWNMKKISAKEMCVWIDRPNPKS